VFVEILEAMVCPAAVAVVLVWVWWWLTLLDDFSRLVLLRDDFLFCGIVFSLSLIIL